jgi:microsomal dipeptidase-like Zn-dependent dipeptidase
MHCLDLKAVAVGFVVVAGLCGDARAAAPPAVTGLTATTPGPGQVLLDWDPSPGATSYRVYRSHDPLLTLQPPLFLPALVSGAPTPFESFATAFPELGLTPLTRYFYVVTAVNDDGESPVSFLGQVRVRTTAAPDAPVSGFIDSHNHQFGNLAFGGAVIGGSPVGDPATALVDVHGLGGINDIVGNIFHGRFGHDTGGWSQFNGWPRWNDSTHQQMHADWLYRAFEGGLRLVVMNAVNNELLCHVDQGANLRPGAPFPCDDMATADRQIAAAHDMDARTDWYRIATSASQARRIINSGRLAVVLGIEVDTLFGCAGTSSCTDEEIRTRLKTYYDKGVRHLFPVHVFDNGFGGAAQYDPLFNYGNRLTRGRFFDLEQCPPIAPGDDYAFKAQSNLLVSAFASLIGLGNPASNTFASECNQRGLQPGGETLVNAMMDRGMIIDLDHMSVKTADRVLEIAEGRRYAGVVAGHSGPISIHAGQKRSEGGKSTTQVARIAALGGMVSPMLIQGDRQIAGVRADGVMPAPGSTVPNDCSQSSKTFAQAYLETVRLFGGAASAAVGFGSDFNGFAGLPGPRFGAEGCSGDAGSQVPQGNPVAYPFRIHNPNGTADIGSLGMYALGQRAFDYNTQGVAHMGLVPDFIQDLKQSGVTDAQLAPLFRSAERYLHMWDLAEANSKPLPSITLSLDPPVPASGWYQTEPSAVAVASAAPGAPSIADVQISSTGAYVAGPVVSLGSIGSLSVQADGLSVVSATARDRLGRTPVSPATVTARVDRLAPEVTCGTADGLWHGTNVQISCTATDATSGLAVPEDGSFLLTTSIAAGIETDNASTGTRTVGDVAGHSTTAGPVTGNKVDLKAPAIALALPASPVTLGAQVAASYTCSDFGAGVDACAGPVANSAPLDTSSVGTKTFVVNASDKVGNLSSASGSYRVTFDVCLLYDPAKAHKSGSTVPIKVQLCDASRANVSSAAVVLHATEVNRLTSAATGVLDDSGNANPDMDFRFDDGLYIFNLKTTGFSRGTWQLKFTASGDPSVHAVTFQVR